MKPAPGPADRTDFLEVATDHKLLSVETARDIAEEAEDRGLSPAQLAVEKGLLNAVDADVVEILRHPTQAVPGYEILDLLGRGGMGVVFRARQKNLDRVVALKMILFGQMTQPGALARFEQEAISIGRLRHPNLVTAYDFGKQAGRLFFAMELLEGQDLGKAIHEHGQLDEATAWGIARQTTAGLSHAVGAGIVHRDIKPANLFLVAPPEGFSLPPGVPMVKITDFGLAFLTQNAQVSERITAAGNTLGTPQFMAPEQFGDSEVDCRADIYSLGATVYQMLAGQSPFDGKTLAEIVGQKVKGELRPLRDLVPGVAGESVALVQDMMACDAAERIADYPTLLARIDALPPFGSYRPLALGNLSAEFDTDFSTDDVSLAATNDALPSPKENVSTPLESKSRNEKSDRRISVGRLALLMGIVVVVVSTVLWKLTDRALPVSGNDPPYIRSKWVRPLFDGKNISDWRTRSGGWAPDFDAEGGRVLQGSGTIVRPLPQRGNRPLEHYQITLGVNLHEADVVEVHFGVPATSLRNAARNVLRIARAGVSLGRRIGTEGAFDSSSEMSGPTTRNQTEDARYHSLRIERQPRRWHVYFDEKPVGTLAVEPGRERSEFWLVTEGGEATFENLAVRELVRSDNFQRPIAFE